MALAGGSDARPGQLIGAIAAWTGPRLSRQRIDTSAPAISLTGWSIRSLASAARAMARWTIVAAFNEGGASQSGSGSARAIRPRQTAEKPGVTLDEKPVNIARFVS